MKPLIVASTREAAGKTSLCVGLARTVGKRVGYFKPLGDRPLYQKKRLWDYDASLLYRLLKLDVEPEALSLGFDHSKLRYMYDDESILEALRERIEEVGAGRDGVLIESGRNLSFGASIRLDPLTISQLTGYPVLIVAGGDDQSIMDDLAFVKRFVGTDEATVAGVIINRVEHVDDFRQTHLPQIEAMGIGVLGLVPYQESLGARTVTMIADRLFARVLTGENQMARPVRDVLVGAMSVDAAMSAEIIARPDNMVITSGDRSDMIMAAIDAGGTSAIVLTNNIVPPPNVIAHAADAGTPLLLVPGDTYAVALQVERIESILTEMEDPRIDTLANLTEKHVDIEAITQLLA